MKKYRFRINNCKQEEMILEVSGFDFLTARDEAYQYCYKTGYCFLGRV